MHESVAAIASCGVSPIVRIPDNQGWMVKRALDSGAHGIVVPLLYTADDARKLVQSAKFPPMGQRGYGSPFSMGMFDVQGGMSGLQYLQQSNEGLVTIVQIETREAFENVRFSDKLFWSSTSFTYARWLIFTRVPGRCNSESGWDRCIARRTLRSWQ
jgi:2-keto-3-deoxy-L-rhamnonate aldolase RhmA